MIDNSKPGTNQNQGQGQTSGTGTGQSQGQKDTSTPPPAVSASKDSATQNRFALTGQDLDLTIIKTKTGKKITDFRIPADLVERDKELVDLVMKSESMDDKERQYWFNLTEVMNKEQLEKLRGILTRERKKLAEIEAKYGRKKTPKLTPEQVKAKNAQMAAKQKEQAQRLAAREAQIKAKESESEDDILSGLNEV